MDRRQEIDSQGNLKVSDPPFLGLNTHCTSASSPSIFFFASFVNILDLNILQVFFKKGGKFILKKMLNFLSFMVLLYVSGHFKHKKIQKKFLTRLIEKFRPITNSHSFFPYLNFLLYTRLMDKFQRSFRTLGDLRVPVT